MSPIMNRHITILEDDIDIRELCSYILSEEGYQVQSYGDIASFTANAKKSDLFLLDIRLPDGNGLELCDQLKKDQRFSKIPIIMMSAHQRGTSAMLGSRADDFIEKPFDIHYLLQRVARLLH